MNLKFILTIIAVGILGHSYACKCNGPWTIKESYEGADLIVHGSVISKDTVALSETMENEDVGKVSERLKDDKQKLRQFETTYVVRIELRIIESFKGEIHQETVVIHTPLLSATCGFRFEKGKDYIIYPTKRNFLTSMFRSENEGKWIEKKSTFWTTKCTRTTEYMKLEADELRRIK